MFVTLKKQDIEKQAKAKFRFQKDGVGTDLKLICGTKEVMVHKVIIASLSPIIEQVFRAGNEEFTLDEGFDEVIEHFVELCYTGQCEMPDDVSKGRVR